MRTTIVACMLLVLAGIAYGNPPLINIQEPRPIYVEGVSFTVAWTLGYTNETTYDLGTKLYSRVIWKGTILGESEIDLFTEEGLLVQTNSLSDILIDERSNQEIFVENSLTSDFATAESSQTEVFLVPGGVTLLSPIMVILVAGLTREVLYALYIGTFVAAFVVSKYDPFQAFLRVLDTYMPESLGDVDHAFVILFTWFLSGLIACVSKSGGSFGIAEVCRKFAKTRMTVQLVIFLLGFVIFFDDYANTLILGNTMRFVSDALWVSREKLAFLVDATTAPVASIAPISSWIGFEVGLIQAQIDLLIAQGEDLVGISENAYLVFLETIPSRFYPIIMLFFQFFMIVAKREFGPMLVAERRALDEHKLVRDDAKVLDDESQSSMMPEEGTPLKWWNGVIPIVIVIFLVLLSILLTGRTTAQELGLPLTAENIFGNGDSYASLMYGGFTTTLIAWFMYRVQYVVEDRLIFPIAYWIRCKASPGRPLMTMEQNLSSFIDGIKGIFAPVLVLILAWAIGAAITDSGADIFFASALSDSLDPRALPTLTFIIAAVISFCTGTSWGTMSILFPLIVPTAWYASQDSEIFILTISAVLSGAVFGDHCTPISDTTILSSISSRCDVMHHTITQLPYALTVGCVSIILGYLPVGYSAYENYWGLIIGCAFSMVFIIFVGVRVDHPKRRLDGMTIASNFLGRLCTRRKATEECSEDGDEEKATSLFVYDEQYDKEFVDILRPNFWKWSTWKGWFSCKKQAAKGGSDMEIAEDGDMVEELDAELKKSGVEEIVSFDEVSPAASATKRLSGGDSNFVA
ncbi:hypothetical protein NDN08_005049 [Rhodosorus marinus]|uniref:Na+/H+ antiporter NhaC-like C-terminal domain-containing protein n=2 Tax=Rhodosorus marinus TaxID=101924 RepID=A0AAV8V4A0_9RHOD|nr:hypothetical protein NDN08_005049 [Rhodosorus marinus]